MFMPFQILGGFLRALFTVALLAGGIYLLIEWNNHRVNPVTVATQDEMVSPDGVRPENGDSDNQKIQWASWEFGFNGTTALLVGGLILLLWSLMGWSVPLLIFRRGGDKPKPDEPSFIRKLSRPDGSELHVEMHGPDSGPVIIMTHGWSLNSSEWCYARGEMARQFQIITWDLPGLGQSTSPTIKDWSLEKMAADLDAIVALVGDRPIILLGHSIGGMITLTWCRLFPASLGRRVRAIVIVQSTYTNPVRTAALAGLYAALQKPVLEPLCYLMIGLSPLFALLNWLGYLNGSAHKTTERSSFSGKECRWQLDSITRWGMQASPAVIARGFLGMFRYDATATLRRIPVPALIVVGDRNTLCTPEAGTFMAGMIPGARLVTLQDAKHCGLFEHHQPFHASVSQFVSRCFDTSPLSKNPDPDGTAVGIIHK